MAFKKTTYFFQDHVAKEWACIAAELDKTQAFVLSDFILKNATTQPLPHSERLALLSSFLPESDRPRASLFLATIGHLRETFILLPEHIEHCFSQLSPSPKNQALKTLLYRYFESDLKNDWVSCAWDAIGAYKTSSVFLFDEVIFIRSLQPSLVFSELSLAFRSVSQGVAEIELKALGNSQKVTRYSGNLAFRMAHLADAARKAIDSDKDQVLVPFCGEPALADTLATVLASRGLTVRTLEVKGARSEEQKEPFESFGGAYLQNLRAAPFSILERLSLVDAALAHPDRDMADSPEFWPKFWTQRHQRGQITDSHLEWLLSRGQTPETPETPEKPQATPESPTKVDVIIGPFVIPPTTASTQVFAFLSDDPLSEHQNSLLREDECNQLIRQGFPLPSRSDYRSRIMTQCGLADTLYGPQDFSGSGDTPSVVITTSPGVSGVLDGTSEPRADDPFTIPSKPLSATSLQNYAKCPALYFYSHRLRLKDTSALDPQGFSLLFGDTTHRTLEAFFKRPERSPQRSYDELPKLFETIVAEAYPNLGPNHPTMTRLKARFLRIAKHIPALEKQVITLFGATTPLFLEKSFEGSIQGACVRGKIDRIDRTADGRYVLFDFKTGTVDFSPGHIQSGDDFQVAVYLLMAAQPAFNLAPVAGFLFYDLKKGELRRGLVREEMISPDSKALLIRGHVLKAEKFDLLIEAGREHIVRIGRAIERDERGDGAFSPTPSLASCEHCSFTAHCRRRYGTDA